MKDEVLAMFVSETSLKVSVNGLLPDNVARKNDGMNGDVFVAMNWFRSYVCLLCNIVDTENRRCCLEHLPSVSGDHHDVSDV